MPAALDKTKVAWIASDNSRTPEQQPLGKALTVPRHPTNIYYNTATQTEQLDEYNYLYYENCVNTAVTTCLTAPVDWGQYVEREAGIMLGHMLTNDVRPHYVHQANLAEGRVLYDVLDKALDQGVGTPGGLAKCPGQRPGHREHHRLGRHRHLDRPTRRTRYRRSGLHGDDQGQEEGSGQGDAIRGAVRGFTLGLDHPWSRENPHPQRRCLGSGAPRYG
ncbi:MAG: hypothetical protein HYR89_09845 [Actinobacteria bacterium]|nr:hypothetical protein [Actinomycetota bacterium]